MYRKRVRRSGILKKIKVDENLGISIRANEITVYKVIINQRGHSTVVYTLDSEEWQKVLPVLQKIVSKFS